MALCRDAPTTNNQKTEMKTTDNQKPSDKPQGQASLASATCSAAASKNKNYLVQIIAYATVLVVDAESEEKAMEYATDACSMGDLQLDSARVDQEITDDRLENARKHADIVAEE